jgi:hypothetical protein
MAFSVLISTRSTAVIRMYAISKYPWLHSVADITIPEMVTRTSLQAVNLAADIHPLNHTPKLTTPTSCGNGLSSQVKTSLSLPSCATFRFTPLHFLPKLFSSHASSYRCYCPQASSQPTVPRFHNPKHRRQPFHAAEWKQAVSRPLPRPLGRCMSVLRILRDETCRCAPSVTSVTKSRNLHRTLRPHGLQ